MRVALRCLLVVLALVSISHFVLFHRVMADETSPAEEPDLKDPLEIQMGEATWSLVEVIEQQHISAPSRESLMAAVVELMIDRRDGNAGHSKVRELARMTRAEFTAAFAQMWYRNHRLQFHSAEEYFHAFLSNRSLRIQVVPAAEYAVQDQLQNNRYVGLGVNVGGGQIGAHLTFSRIVPGGAADRAGLVNGETVLSVDGRDTANVPVNDVVTKMLRGPRGTQVTLKLAPNGKLPEREVTLTRSVVRIDAVYGRNGTPVSRADFRDQPEVPVGYLAVGLGGSTLNELRDAEVRLRADGIRVLILDFRSRISSRSFHHARLIADGLLDGGTIWSWQDRSGDLHIETADRECLFRGMPLVVLVDPNIDATTAHLAAALQDAGRATIVGESPDGCGLIENAFPICDGQYYVMLDSAKLFRSRSDQSWPLRPDEDTSLGRLSVSFPANSVPTGTTDLQMTPMSPEVMKFFVERGVGPGVQSVSALFPTNIPPVETLRRLAPQAMIRQFSSTSELNRREQYEVAQAVALRLLKQMDQPSLEASKSVNSNT